MAVLDTPAPNAYGLETNSMVTLQKPRAKTTPLLGPANTSLSAPTNVTEIYQAGPKGGRVHLIEAVGTAAQAATQIQLFRSAGDGVAKRFLRAKAFPAFAINNTGDALPNELPFTDLKSITLEPNEKLWAGSPVAVTGINVNVEGADY
ncbi:MAG: hypothetical protein KBC34_00935 [Phenylobacterium sp.]|nr:hypothetical protein [Phenylobacterium sp.]